MTFAPVSFDLSYWQKAKQPLFTDLTWNLPERKTGRVAVLGGNRQSFSTPVRISEYLARQFPIQTVATLLPDALRPKLPPLPNLTFFPSTASGSFDRSPELRTALADPDATLFIGDLSKNSATTIALAEAIRPAQLKHPTDRGTTTPRSASPTSSQPAPSAPSPLLVLARDSLDALAPEATSWLTRGRLIIVASLLQLQKLLRAIYYPRMVMLSQPLVPTLETLHKFTLSYPVALCTFHQGQIITAHQGQVITTPLELTTYSPLTLWSGQLAANILALNLYNPSHPLEATTAALTYA